MSITDELREYARIHQPYKSELYNAQCADEITAIADRIDERHKYAIGYVDDRDPETMAEHGWVRLPKDADGECIHFGDVLDQFGTPMTVFAMSDPDPDQGDCMLELITDGISDGTWVRARKMRHHHAPTVEDVLTEFGIDWEHESDCEDRAALLKEYASKLKLVEEDA